MSIDFTVPLQREAKAKHDSDGDVAVAGIWLALYLVMVVRTLLVNLNGPVMGLVLFVAAIGGCGVLGWRRNKRTMALVRYGTTVMKSAIFRVAVLIGLLGGVFGSANANTVDVSYTISGSPGNWTYNFLVTNNINVAQNVYAFGVHTPGTVGASPTNWSDQSSQASSFDSDLHSLPEPIECVPYNLLDALPAAPVCKAARDPITECVASHQRPDPGLLQFS